jgi:hypothetical protein
MGLSNDYLTLLSLHNQGWARLMTKEIPTEETKRANAHFHNLHLQFLEKLQILDKEEEKKGKKR